MLIETTWCLSFLAQKFFSLCVWSERKWESFRTFWFQTHKHAIQYLHSCLNFFFYLAKLLYQWKNSRLVSTNLNQEMSRISPITSLVLIHSTCIFQNSHTQFNFTNNRCRIQILNIQQRPDCDIKEKPSDVAKTIPKLWQPNSCGDITFQQQILVAVLSF